MAGSKNVCATRENMKILWNKTQEKPLLSRLEIANSFLSRFCGLLGKKGLSREEGLLITRCHQVHMFFMVFPIDVIFCSRDNRVVHLEKHLQPWRISPSIAEAEYVIEIQAGLADELKIALGDVLESRHVEGAPNRSQA